MLLNVFDLQVSARSANTLHAVSASERSRPGVSSNLGLIPFLRSREDRPPQPDVQRSYIYERTPRGLTPSRAFIEMNTAGDDSPSVVGVATSGIQDVSALLPLLGTDQCERLVTSALQHGLLYAAATPMSIFGSLGIVKAGFVVLWGTIDNRFFRGPTLLRNAGFTTSGVGNQLVPVTKDDRRLYVVEEKLRRHISKVKIKSVEVNLLSGDCWLWNLRLVGITILLSSLGLLPYVYIIRRFLSDSPFRTTWLYPTMRVLGCDLVAITIQCIFQIRTLEEVYHRLCFQATDGYLRDNKEPVPEVWDSDERSKFVFGQRQNSHHSLDPKAPPLLFEPTRKLASFLFRPRASTLPLQDEKSLSANEDVAEKAGMGEVKPASLFLSQPAHHHLIIALALWTARIFLLLGLGMSVVGYTGCFSIVQSSPKNDSKGSLVWLVCEAALGIIRTLFWAWNPPHDDAPSPIALEKIDPTLGSGPDAQGPQQKGRTYGVGWMLESLTTNDVHALIVGIDQQGHPKQEGESDAQDVANYLHDTLFVPRHQIVTLTNADATKAKVVDALNDLRVDGTTNEAYLLPYSNSNEHEKLDADGLKNICISYRSIVDILQNIAEERTENITLILECQHAQDMAPNKKFKAPARGHPSHIVLGAASSDEYERGLFTNKLLRVLGSLAGSDRLPRMTYKDLVQLMNLNKMPEEPSRQRRFRDWILSWFMVFGHADESEPEEKGEAVAFCTTLYQNRRLLGGLFSRKLAEGGSDPVITITYSDL